MPELRLHDLRHSYASFLVNAGRSLYEVQKLLGHHDPKVTMRYAHLSPQAMLEAVNVVGNVVGRRPVVANQAAVATARYLSEECYHLSDNAEEEGSATHRGRAFLSDQGFEAVALEQVEQLLRWAAGVLVTQLPLANSGRAGIEQ